MDYSTADYGYPIFRQIHKMMSVSSSCLATIFWRFQFFQNWLKGTQEAPSKNDGIYTCFFQLRFFQQTTPLMFEASDVL